MAFTSFQLVVGVHDCTPVPSAARAHGLTHRFALVQSTQAPGLTDLVVDPAPLLVLLATLDDLAGAPGTVYWDANRRRRASRREVESHYDANVLEDYRIVAAGEWRRAGQIVVLLSTESWHAVGGAGLYRDSITYSFYCADDRAAELRDALLAAGLAPAAIVEAPEPLDPPHPAAPWPPFHIVALIGALLAGAVGVVVGILDLERRAGPAALWLGAAGGLALVWAAGLFVRRHHADDLR